MSDQLSLKQKKFADAYIRLSNGTKAAIEAGYSKSGAHVEASRLLKNPKIISYIDEKRAEIESDLRKLFAKDAIQARKVLVDILNDRKASHAVKLQAAKDLLDRAGYRPTEKVEHTGNVAHTYEEQLQNLIEKGVGLIEKPGENHIQ